MFQTIGPALSPSKVVARVRLKRVELMDQMGQPLIEKEKIRLKEQNPNIDDIEIEHKINKYKESKEFEEDVNKKIWSWVDKKIKNKKKELKEANSKEEDPKLKMSDTEIEYRANEIRRELGLEYVPVFTKFTTSSFISGYNNVFNATDSEIITKKHDYYENQTINTYDDINTTNVVRFGSPDNPNPPLPISKEGEIRLLSNRIESLNEELEEIKTNRPLSYESEKIDINEEIRLLQNEINDKKAVGAWSPEDFNEFCYGSIIPPSEEEIKKRIKNKIIDIDEEGHYTSLNRDFGIRPGLMIEVAGNWDHVDDINEKEVRRGVIGNEINRIREKIKSLKDEMEGKKEDALETYKDQPLEKQAKIIESLELKNKELIKSLEAQIELLGMERKRWKESNGDMSVISSDLFHKVVQNIVDNLDRPNGPITTALDSLDEPDKRNQAYKDLKIMFGMQGRRNSIDKLDELFDLKQDNLQNIGVKGSRDPYAADMLKINKLEDPIVLQIGDKLYKKQHNKDWDEPKNIENDDNQNFNLKYDINVMNKKGISSLIKRVEVSDQFINVIDDLVTEWVVNKVVDKVKRMQDVTFTGEIQVGTKPEIINKFLGDMDFMEDKYGIGVDLSWKLFGCIGIHKTRANQAFKDVENGDSALLAPFKEHIKVPKDATKEEKMVNLNNFKDWSTGILDTSDPKRKDKFGNIIETPKSNFNKYLLAASKELDNFDAIADMDQINDWVDEKEELEIKLQKIEKKLVDSENTEDKKALSNLKIEVIEKINSLENEINEKESLTLASAQKIVQKAFELQAKGEDPETIIQTSRKRKEEKDKENKEFKDWMAKFSEIVKDINEMPSNENIKKTILKIEQKEDINIDDKKELMRLNRIMYVREFINKYKTIPQVNSNDLKRLEQRIKEETDLTKLEELNLEKARIEKEIEKKKSIEKELLDKFRKEKDIIKKAELDIINDKRSLIQAINNNNPFMDSKELADRINLNSKEKSRPYVTSQEIDTYRNSIDTSSNNMLLTLLKSVYNNSKSEEGSNNFEKIGNVIKKDSVKDLFRGVVESLIVKVELILLEASKTRFMSGQGVSKPLIGVDEYRVEKIMPGVDVGEVYGDRSNPIAMIRSKTKRNIELQNKIDKTNDPKKIAVWEKEIEENLIIIKDYQRIMEEMPHIARMAQRAESISSNQNPYLLENKEEFEALMEKMKAYAKGEYPNWDIALRLIKKSAHDEKVELTKRENNIIGEYKRDKELINFLHKNTPMLQSMGIAGSRVANRFIEPVPKSIDVEEEGKLGNRDISDEVSIDEGLFGLSIVRADNIRNELLSAYEFSSGLSKSDNIKEINRLKDENNKLEEQIKESNSDLKIEDLQINIDINNKKIKILTMENAFRKISDSMEKSGIHLNSIDYIIGQVSKFVSSPIVKHGLSAPGVADKIKECFKRGIISDLFDNDYDEADEVMDFLIEQADNLVEISQEEIDNIQELYKSTSEHFNDLIKGVETLVDPTDLHYDDADIKIMTDMVDLMGDIEQGKEVGNIEEVVKKFIGFVNSFDSDQDDRQVLSEIFEYIEDVDKLFELKHLATLYDYYQNLDPEEANIENPKEAAKEIGIEYQNNVFSIKNQRFMNTKFMNTKFENIEDPINAKKEIEKSIKDSKEMIEDVIEKIGKERRRLYNHLINLQLMMKLYESKWDAKTAEAMGGSPKNDSEEIQSNIDKLANDMGYNLEKVGEAKSKHAKLQEEYEEIIKLRDSLIARPSENKKINQEIIDNIVNRLLLITRIYNRSIEDTADEITTFDKTKAIQKAKKNFTRGAEKSAQTLEISSCELIGYKVNIVEVEKEILEKLPKEALPWDIEDYKRWKKSRRDTSKKREERQKALEVLNLPANYSIDELNDAFKNSDKGELEKEAYNLLINYLYERYKPRLKSKIEEAKEKASEIVMSLNVSIYPPDTPKFREKFEDIEGKGVDITIASLDNLFKLGKSQIRLDGVEMSIVIKDKEWNKEWYKEWNKKDKEDRDELKFRLIIGKIEVNRQYD
jgi:hypothetical protein